MEIASLTQSKIIYPQITQIFAPPGKNLDTTKAVHDHVHVDVHVNVIVVVDVIGSGRLDFMKMKT